MHILLSGQFAGLRTTGSGQYFENLIGALRRAAPGYRIESAVPPQRLGQRLDKLWWEQVGWPLTVLGRRPDVCHVPYFCGPLLGRIDVVTVHDLIGFAMPEYAADPRWQFYLQLMGSAVKRARLVIADSEATAADIVNFLQYPRERIRVILLGVNPAPSISRAEIDLHLRDLQIRRPYCLYLGSGDVRKNISTAIRALARIDESRRPQLVIAGAVPNAGTELLPDHAGLAQSLGIDAWVRFTGRVSEARKHALYAGARMLLFPSRYEGFGLEPLEAMAHRVPVIAADCSAVPEVTGGAALLLSPDEPDHWAEAIQVLDSDTIARTELIDAGTARVAELNWLRTAQQTLAVYRELA